MNRMPLWHLVVDTLTGDITGGFVFSKLGDASNVSLVVRERFGNERVDKRHRFIHGVLPSPDRNHVGIIVLPCEFGGRDTPHQCGPDAPHLVCGDLLAVARASENHAERFHAGGLVTSRRERGVDAKRGVIVKCVVLRRTVVDNLVTRLPKVILQVLTELETGMVGRHVDAHTQDFRAVRLGA